MTTIGPNVKALLAFVFFTGIGVFFFGNYVFGAADIVNEEHNTDLDRAIQNCQQQRQEIESEGNVCEPCQVVCPSDVESNGDGTYDFSYSEGGMYEGTYENIQCDKISGATPDTFYNSNLLEVKSKCSSTEIRYDEEQVGEGTLISTEEVDGGEIQEIEAEFQLVNPETGNTLPGETKTKFQLKCGEDYLPEGKTVGESKSALGECVLSDELGETLFDGDFAQIKTSKSIDGQRVVAVGKYQVLEPGSGYIYSQIIPSGSQNDFSVITGEGQIDVCGDNEYLTGRLYEDIERGEKIVFRNEISTQGLSSGTYQVVTGTFRSCDQRPSVSQAGQVVKTVTVESDETTPALNEDEETRQEQDDQGSETVVGEQDEDELRNKTEQAVNNGVVPGKSCDEGSLRAGGCQMAQCVNGEIELLSDSVCLDDDQTNVSENKSFTEEEADQVRENIEENKEELQGDDSFYANIGVNAVWAIRKVGLFVALAVSYYFLREQ